MTLELKTIRSVLLTMICFTDYGRKLDREGDVMM